MGGRGAARGPLPPPLRGHGAQTAEAEAGRVESSCGSSSGRAAQRGLIPSARLRLSSPPLTERTQTFAPTPPDKAESGGKRRRRRRAEAAQQRAVKAVRASPEKAEPAAGLSSLLALARDAHVDAPGVETLEQDARLAHSLAADVPAALAPPGLGGRGVAVGYAHLLGGTDDIDHRRRASRLEVLHELPGKAPSGEGCVDALGAEVVEPLEVGVHDDLLLVGPLEGLAARELLLLARDDVGASAEPPKVTPYYIEDDSLRNVIRVVTRHNLVGAEHYRPAVQRLASEDATKRAVVLLPNLGNNLIHRPVVKLLVGDNPKRYAVLLFIPFHRFK
mmetsp:Transcript_4960/g.12083  ORF Transcript_4960/g.12083 Transcript_4960/m.12083 type:complete len:333 (-) Transcript_4960:571-1569(-)